MTKYAVVLVPFPFDGNTDSKVRPALCLTGKIGKYEHVIIAFISSKIPSELENSEIVIKKGSSDWEGTGLAVDSIVKLQKIVALPKYLIKRKLGVINTKLQKEVLKKVIFMFENK